MMTQLSGSSCSVVAAAGRRVDVADAQTIQPARAAAGHYPMKIFGALVATGLLVSPAVALDGELVTNNAFPFVVKIRAVYTKPTGSFTVCTATVLEPRLILTAANCISKPHRGADGPDSFVHNISKDVTIYYTDAGGQERAAKSKSTFYGRGFLSNFSITPASCASKPPRRCAQNFSQVSAAVRTGWSTSSQGPYTVADVAYIVPDHRIELKVYPRIVFDDFKPEQYLDGSGNWLTSATIKCRESPTRFGFPSQSIHARGCHIRWLRPESVQGQRPV
jgi:hypothetical protein